ncbi:MAG: VOC family protein, partial [Steroidobacteraceae bacterium]
MKRPMQLLTPAGLCAMAIGYALAQSPARPPITAVSHIALYSANPASSEHFYVHDLGAVKRPDPENAAGARYYFAPTQFVEVLPLPPGPRSINRLDHVAFATSDARRLRDYLGSKKIAVPTDIHRGADGSRWFEVTDPEGNRVEFVQPPERPAPVPVNPLSSHMIHVGFIIHNRA